MQWTTEIERAAADGDLSAMTTLGKLALIGQAGSLSPVEGTKLLLAAGERGNGEADSVISVLIAADARELRDWSLALGYLQRAAERGWPTAQKQLCLLACDRDLVMAVRAGRCDNSAWEQLRDSVDMPALLRSPPAVEALRTPRIRTFTRFASPAECGWMIERSRERMAPAQVFNWETGKAETHSSRTNSAVRFNILDTDFILALLRARIAGATQFARTSLEEINVLHYEAGQEFKRHFDWFNPADDASAAEIRTKGQRAATFLIYLNDDFEGAETDFPLIGWRYKGSPGDALCFMNVDEAGNPDRTTLHAGLAPAAGEKWLLSQWIRGIPGVGV